MGRVLVVDDNADVRESFGFLCELWGHEVATAADAGEALALVAAFKPDVVLLDLGLPGDLDGPQVARRIRATEGRGIFIVALTGWTRREDRERALGAGIDVFSLKPPDLDELKRTIAIGALHERARQRSS
jgi:CheY-like chemotaxis protein